MDRMVGALLQGHEQLRLAIEVARAVLHAFKQDRARGV
jgi:hypothetical protein